MDIRELVNDEAIKSQLENAKNVGEVAELLRANGIDVSEEMISEAVSSQGELDEGSLENVSGGIMTFPLLPYKIVQWLLSRF